MTANVATVPAGHTALMLGRGIRTAAARVPDKTALICGAQTRSYRQLTDRMARLGDVACGGFGIAPGDIVALVAPNCVEYLEIVAGLSDQGAIVATLNPRLSEAEFAAILADCAPKLAVVHADCAAAMAALAAARVPSLTLGPAYEQALADAKALAPRAIDEQAPFAISYTSGTTGAPKGVLLSHRSRALLFLAMAAEYGCFGHDDHFLGLAPLYHGAGFAFACAPLWFGGCCTVLPHFAAEEVLDHIASGRPSGVFMVPTHFHRLLALPPERLARARRGQRLKAIISNAAALPQTMKEKIIAAFGEGLLHETYGSTEGGIVTNIRPADQLCKPGSVGTPFVAMEVDIRDESGAPVPPGTVGELFCRGPYSFSGYLNRPDDTAQALIDGWVGVGDMAVRDTEGYIAIVDRKKDMVVTGGVNVYPREIEIVIEALPGVADVAVVGLPDAEWGERLHAFVVAAPGAALGENDIIAACRARLARFKVPRGVSMIEALPRSASGKVLKKALRQRAQGAAT
ncbi:MAG: AMP-dependent synthetase [Alphaproteobacteria bacterium]|nr:MAG: AMP-dependent synthetase [Alphaproteobacteria bacterium]